MNEYRNDRVEQAGIRRRDLNPRLFAYIEAETGGRVDFVPPGQNVAFPRNVASVQCTTQRNQGLLGSTGTVPHTKVSRMDTLSTHRELGTIDASVGALAFIERGHIVAKLRKHLESDSPQQDLDTVLVTDLLNGSWYLVSRMDKGIQLLVGCRDRFILAQIDSETDFIEVANRLSRELSI